MALVEIGLDLPPDSREIYEDVVGKGPQGASPRGSTYWRRVQLCAHEHGLANELGWERLPRADALDIGLLWHGCLETYYLALMALQRGQYRPQTPEQEAFLFLEKFAGSKGWGTFYETVSRMLDAYFTRWRDNNDWEILAVEYSVGWTHATDPVQTAKIGFEYTTRLDMVVVDHSLIPATRHIEHKSSSRLDALTVQGYGQDDQVLGQCVIAQQIPWQDNGFPPYVGALVNITTKQKMPLCERVPVSPSPEQLTSWAQAKRFWSWQSQQYEAWAYPKNYANCTRRFGRCQFFQLCRSHPMEGLVQLRHRDSLGPEAMPFGYRKIDGAVMEAVED